MFKPARKYRKPLPFRYAFILSIIIFTLFTVWGLWMIDKGIKPTLLSIAQTKADQIAAYAINYGIGKKDIQDMQDLEKGNLKLDTNTDKIITLLQDDQGNVISYSYNSAEGTRLMNQIQNRIQYYLRSIEDGSLPLGYVPDDVKVQLKGDSKEPKGVVTYIPLGQATNNALLSNLGPKVPVHFEVISNVQTDLKDKIQPSGINNTFIKIWVTVKVNVRIVIPFAIKDRTMSTDILIAQQFIPGKVPDYYSSGNNGLSPTIPIEPSTGASNHSSAPASKSNTSGK